MVGMTIRRKLVTSDFTTAVVASPGGGLGREMPVHRKKLNARGQIYFSEKINYGCFFRNKMGQCPPTRDSCFKFVLETMMTVFRIII